MHETNEARTHRWASPQFVAVAALLALPVLALLWVSSYAKPGPRLLGFPFFYWYQFAWVFLAAACTSIAYRIVLSSRRDRDGEGRR